jgi:arylsulfatase
VTEKLLKGYKVGDMTYKVHLDGYNLVPYQTGQAEKNPRESFLYCNDDQQLVGLRYGALTNRAGWEKVTL